MTHTATPGLIVAGVFVVVLMVVLGTSVELDKEGVADPAAFAITFLVFFFVYLGLEVLLVERSLD